MTTYEAMGRKHDLLVEAAIRCRKNGAFDMAETWLTHARKIIAIMGRMPMCVAAKEE